MSHSNNPFVRGYDSLSVQRLLAIAYDDDCPLSYLPLHVSQSHLPDSQVELHACVFCDDFALITEGQNVPPELDAQCPSHGIARNLVYAVMAEEAGKPLHVGDTYSEEAAGEVVRRLRFETGFYSRAWEISSAHITEEAGRFLAELADIATPSGFLFVAFRIPYSPAVGVKLIATPWTDANLQHVEGITAEELRQEHRAKGVPESLVEVLHLAALADVRLLVFDADAPILQALTVYGDELPSLEPPRGARPTFADSGFPSDDLYASAHMLLPAFQFPKHPGEPLDRRLLFSRRVSREPHQETGPVPG